MIFGLGTDIIQISRIDAALRRSGERFAEKIIGPDELILYRARKAKVAVRGLRFLATRFAAKEAFSKAIGLGMRMPMHWRALQTLNDRSGKPILVASGALAQWMAEQGVSARVSLSDEADFAVAFVIAERLPLA